MTIVARTPGPPVALAGAMRAASVFAAIPALLVAVVALACALPAARAARLDPAIALRDE